LLVLAMVRPGAKSTRTRATCAKYAFDVEEPTMEKRVPLCTIAIPLSDQPPSSIFAARHCASGVGSS